MNSRACPQNHSFNLPVPFCEKFIPDSVPVARYDALIRDIPTNCDAHLAEGIFQTRSKIKTTIHILLFPNMHGCFLVFCICNVKEQKVKSYTPSFLFFTLCCNCS